MTPAFPPTLTINVTTRCGAACVYCHWWKARNPDPPISDLLDRLGQAIGIGVRSVRISGGEPLLRNDLVEVIRFCADRGVASMVCTAGRTAASLERLIDEGLKVVSISLDTVDPNLFFRLRGYSVEPVLENLRRLATLRGDGRFEVVLSVVLTRWNMNEIGPLLSFAERHDLVVNVTPVVGDDPRRSADLGPALTLGREDAAGVSEFVHQVQRSAQSGLRVLNHDSFLDGIPEFLSRGGLPPGYRCQAYRNGAIVLHNGCLKLCHSLQPLGAGPLSVQWASKRADAQRASMEALQCPGCWLSCHADPRRDEVLANGVGAAWRTA
jgi:MoaA/NifB/PqqE/SkfB family radical SAM enzyme